MTQSITVLSVTGVPTQHLLSQTFEGASGPSIWTMRSEAVWTMLTTTSNQDDLGAAE